MKRLARDGGCDRARPGRTPRGAKKCDRKAASSSLPSDWYDEKSCAAAMNVRKQTPATAMETRGQRLRISVIEAISPMATNVSSARSLDEIHTRDGINQNAFHPSAALAAWQYAPAGRMPRGPIRPLIWNQSE